jgi:hypothetical protein
MKNYIHVHSDGSIERGVPTRRFIATMTRPTKPASLGDDYIIDREVAKQLMTSVGSTEEFNDTWEAYLETRRGDSRETIVRAFVLGVFYGGLTEDEAYSRAMERNCPESCTRHFLVEEETIPYHLTSDRHFRNAVRADDSGNIQVSMPDARAIHLEEIRRVRNEELVKKDVPFMRAVEAGDTDAQATIGAEKQVLRDIPATFDITTGVDTPEKLKAKWPDTLPARE